ncbi:MULTISPECIES: sensor histidine kinase [Sphingomonas]|uniref:sensor histidine kinase n=1 Tax=Sphingomonas TaxID=13687 RepID=UPI000AA563E4|nr:MULTISPECIES: histidine kinase dimerization/phosphoacceptor domain -containing protein [Sphingomonas]
MIDRTPVSVQKSVRWIERLPVARDRPVFGMAIMLAIVAAAWLLRDLADPFLPPGFPYVTFFPAVIVSSFLFGVRIGAVSALLCGLLAWYCFIPPTGFKLTTGAAFALAFYVFVVATDLVLVHWMQVANRQLAAEREVSRSLADTRELLFRELQHRVSNNLQVAAALLTMQRRELADAGERSALDEAAARLALIGRISRQLYDASGVAQPLVPFLSELGLSVIEAAGRHDVTITASGDERLRLVPDAAVPVALIVAEAVANALEHGFADGTGGRLAIAVEQDPGRGLCITVHDDGHGLPADFDLDSSTSLGLRIATTLARGQGGRFHLERCQGTRATLILPPGLSADGAATEQRGGPGDPLADSGPHLLG